MYQLDSNVSWHNEVIGKRVVEALRKNNFSACYVKSGNDAVKLVLAEVEKEASIGIGGSVTLNEIGLIQAMEKGSYHIYDHNKEGLTREESLQIRRNELMADVFITSSNAITMNGELVNTDGSGNRVAGMIFGPRKVFVIAGINKIVSDINAAIERIKNIAAPINAKRLQRKTPCAITGECADCSSPERICCVTTIMNKKPVAIEMKVIIIGEEFGY